MVIFTFNRTVFNYSITQFHITLVPVRISKIHGENQSKFRYYRKITRPQFSRVQHATNPEFQIKKLFRPLHGEHIFSDSNSHTKNGLEHEITETHCYRVSLVKERV